MSKRASLLAAALVATAVVAIAANPRGTSSATVAGKKVTIDYGRPALKGRSLDALMKDLPADKMWRAGENQVTIASFEGDVKVGGKTVPAGKYSVYVHAGEGGKWELVLNKDQGVALGKIWAQAPENMKNEPWPYLQDYTGKIGAQEAARVPLTATKPAAPADLFTISLEPKGAGAALTLAWGDQAWTTDVTPAS
jgi:hypothetical protein